MSKYNNIPNYRKRFKKKVFEYCLLNTFDTNIVTAEESLNNVQQYISSEYSKMNNIIQSDLQNKIMYQCQNALFKTYQKYMEYDVDDWHNYQQQCFVDLIFGENTSDKAIVQNAINIAQSAVLLKKEVV